MTTVDLPSPEALSAASSLFTFALLGIGALIVGSAIAAATWARSLSGWAFGSISFVLSQTAQVVTLFLFGPLVAAFASAPLQEVSRALILATAARRVRGERPSTAFGFGHGAIDLLTSSLIPTLSAVIILDKINDGSIFVGQSSEAIDKVHAVAIFFTNQTSAFVLVSILQGALILGLHALLTAITLRAVVRGGGARTIGRGLLLPVAIHLPVAVVRTLFPAVATPVLLGAVVIAVLVYRRGEQPMAESLPAQ